jgi:hypothetical protein
LCGAGLVLSFLPETGSRLMYVAAPVCMVAGVALFVPVKRLFENRVGDFLGWISFPLYLVQAAVIYSFSVRGLDVLASFGFEPSMQRWLVGIATVPVAFFFEGASDASAVATSEKDTRSLALMDDFVSSPEGLRLVQSFTQIEDADVRRRIVDLMQAIGSKN